MSCLNTNSIVPILKAVFVIIIADIIRTQIDNRDILMSINCLYPLKYRGN